MADGQCAICLFVNDADATVCDQCDTPISGSDGNQGAEDAESDESATSEPDSAQEGTDDDSSRARRSRPLVESYAGYPADFGGRA